MGILNWSRKRMRRLIDRSYCVGQFVGEIRKIRNPRRRKLINQVNLTADQEKKIKQFYKENYGKWMGCDWHRLYQSFTGNFTEQYFPEILFSSVYEPRVNPEAYRYVLDDKLLLNAFVGGVNDVFAPKMIATYCNGIYFDDQHRVYTLDELAEKLADIGEVVLKRVQDTSSGRGVRLYSFSGGMCGSETVRDVLSFHSDAAFIIQEKVRLHESLKVLHADSVNTFRITTYLWQGKVWHCPVTLRIGQGGNFLDNSHAGGMFVTVSDEGVLADTAYTEFQKIYKQHPDSKVIFKGYRIPFVPDLIDAAKRLHLSAPQLGVISWDLTINECGEFILIETNTTGQGIWLSQMASGKSPFGENTAEVLRFLRDGK